MLTFEQQLRSALEVALFNNPLVLSFLVGDDSLLGPELGLYVTMRQTREILDKCIMDYGTVDTVEDVRKIARHYPFKDHSMLPGPLFRALIVFVRETKSAAAIMNSTCLTFRTSYDEKTSLTNITSFALCSRRDVLRIFH